MDKTHTVLLYGRPAQGLWQCPYEDCVHVGTPYPSSGTLDENGNRVRRWQCTECRGYFRKPPMVSSTAS